MKNKKGVLGLSMTELLGVVLVSGIIIVTVVALGRFLSIFQNTKDADAINNFEELQTQILMLIDSEDRYSVNYVNIFVPRDYIIVGYDFNKPDVYTECSDESAKKRCHGKPCLCLHKNSRIDDFDGDKNAEKHIITCYEFNENVIFLAHADDQSAFQGKKKASLYDYYEKTRFYEDLFIYGNGCKKEDFGTAKLYMDRFYDEEDDIHYVYVNRVPGNEDYLNLRESELLAKYGLDGICKEKIAGSNIIYLEIIAREADEKELDLHEIPMDDDRTIELSEALAKEFTEVYDISEGDAVNIIYGNRDLDMEELAAELESRKGQDGSIKYPKKVSPLEEDKDKALEICRNIGKECFEFLESGTRKICESLV